MISKLFYMIKTGETKTGEIEAEILSIDIEIIGEVILDKVGNEYHKVTESEIERVQKIVESNSNFREWIPSDTMVLLKKDKIFLTKIINKNRDKDVEHLINSLMDVCEKGE